MRPSLRPALALVLSVLAPTAFVAMLFPPELMFSPTTAAGGDLGSHNYAASWLRNLLPDLRMTGWVPGSYCGFPLFQIYFPAPFLLGALLSVAADPNVAFKLMSVAGLLTLPAASALLLRHLRVPFPGPQIGASAVLLFLFQGGNAMWGGNVASTLAGEFAYSLSLPVALAYLGVHARAATSDRMAALAAAIVAVLAMTHAYTVLWIALTAGFAALVQPRWVPASVRTAAIFLWGGALCAFWLGPLLWYSPWTTAYKHVWIVNSFTEVFPRALWPAVAASVALPLVIRWRGRERWRAYWIHSRLLYLAAGTGALAYLVAPNFGIVDVRFLPFFQLAVCLLAAAAAGHALHGVMASWLWIPIAFLAAVALSLPQLPTLQAWSRWNYEGFERKAGWPLYAEIASILRGDLSQPRVAYEHALEHEALGSVRAFENLPLFTGRSTLEGVNLQASVTSPFVFYVQSEISAVMSCPFPEWGCSRPNLASGVEHLRMMHVSDVILRSDAMKDAAAELDGLAFRASVGSYDIYRVLKGRGGYAVPLDTPPDLVVTGDWKADAYRWFKRAAPDDPIPVFVSRSSEARGHVFGLPGTGSGRPAHPPGDTTGNGTPVESLEAERLVVTGVRPGQPLLIRISYHPRWRSTTGERVWLAGPGFMLVVPETDRVELVYGSTFVTRTAAATTWLALALMVAVVGGAVRVGGRRDDRAAKSLAFVPLVCLLSAAFVVAGFRARRLDADMVYRSGQRELDGGSGAEARARFARARELAPLSNTAIHSFYFEAISLYREERWAEASLLFQDMLRTFPEAPSAAEAQYHIGLCAEKLGDKALALEAMRETQAQFPGTIWSDFARDRIREWTARPQ